MTIFEKSCEIWKTWINLNQFELKQKIYDVSCPTERENLSIKMYLENMETLRKLLWMFLDNQRKNADQLRKISEIN